MAIKLTMPFSGLIIFQDSGIECQGASLYTGRWQGRDVIVAQGAATSLRGAGLQGGDTVGDYAIFPASYENMLTWERRLALAPRLAALHRSGHRRGFGAGNRIVVSWEDGQYLRAATTFGGWDGIYRAMSGASAPFWFVQQSIVRELIPAGVDPAQYPGIGHTGGYGPRELLRAGLFAFASQGGYARYALPIGADADHAIVVGHDEESLARSLAFNKLAIAEACDYSKFTVDTSHLFAWPVALSRAERQRLLAAFRGRRFQVANILAGRPGLQFEFAEEESLRLGRKYWRAGAVHKELYDHVANLRGQQPFDYELSLDETPQPTPPRELLFYLVLLQEVMGVPAGGVASAGPNLGFIKRHDYEGDLGELWAQVNACASILHHFGAVLSVHSADGVRASTGKGPGVDAVLASATAGQAELKVADVYQEVLWQVLAASPEAEEREIFQEAWRRTYEAAQQLAAIYRSNLAACQPLEAQRLLATAAGQERIAREHGEAALRLAQGAIGYGLPVFKLAADLLPGTDPTRPSAEAELFRRFMFLTYRNLRPAIFRSLSQDGWERLAQAI
ncbi:MAG: tagaturonate epimerase family protein, partial [Anaerolineae bacterium]